MKRICCIFFCLVMMQTSYAQKKHFDGVSYSTPEGWMESKKTDNITFTKQKDGNFCVIILYKSVEASADAQKNFSTSWEVLMKQILNVSAPVMQRPSTDNGWETLLGSCSFDKDGVKGAGILITSTRNNKMVNIVCMTNTNIFQKEMEKFLESVDLRSEVTTPPDARVAPQKTAISTPKAKPELWLNRRLTVHTGSIWEREVRTISDFVVIYPNGDFNPNVPYEGLHNFTPLQQPESWGRFTMQGTKGRFKSNYDDIAVTKKSSVLMEKDGYSFGYHKCLPVDGLRIEGAYTHVSPDWGKDPQLDYLDGAGCLYAIYFKKDGSFEDKGIFSSRQGGNGANCPGGKGTYSIENFTITFSYNDGRVVHRLFTAPPPRNPATYNATYYVGGAAWYRKN